MVRMLQMTSARQGIWLIVLIGLVGVQASAAELFVAPNGSDANAGTREKPFATLVRARDEVRKLKGAGALKEPMTVWLRGGFYPVSAAIIFTPADSGTAAAPVTYAAAPGEQPVISGGVRLTGAWTKTPGKPFWQLDVPAARDGKWIFYSLFVNGESRTRARYPNFNEKVLRAEGREPGGDARQALQYLPGDFNPAWSNPKDIDVVLLCSWTPTIHRIKEVLPDRRAIRFFSAHNRTVDFWERNFRYYLSNVYEALDEPGEWYLNRHTGVLYYYPLPGEELSKLEVVAPVVKTCLVNFAGELAAGKGVEHVHFRGLQFRHVDGDMDRYNGMYRQAHMYLGAAIMAQGLRHASFEGCELAQLGEYAMELADGCQDVTVRQCHIWDIGSGAMLLGVTDLPTLKTPLEANAQAGKEVEPRREVKDLVIDNNCIHRLGTIWHGCYGIGNRFASGSKITHNEIFDTHYTAVGLDARWTWKGEKYSHGNEIAYNHFHHLGLRYHTDAAGVYQFGPLDTHIHHNFIHDNIAYPHIAGFSGIYLDEQSRRAVVDNNLVYHVDWSAYHQNKGTDNLFSNNIGAFSRNGFISRGGLDKTWPSNYFEATRNIYIARDATAMENLWQAGTKPPLVHGNMYYTLAKNTPLTFAGKSFAEWQAAGVDAQSVIGDPGCRNPDKFDFSLVPNAPAGKAIGFVPFDAEIQKAGLYGDAAWRDLPKRCTLRQPAPEWADADFVKFNAFDLNFNLMKNGEEPSVFKVTADKGAGFAVTGEVPGLKGPKCLKATDRKGLSKNFYPYLQYSPRGLKEGNVKFTFAVQPSAKSPMRLEVTLRNSGAGLVNGPSLAISRDGKVKAGNETVATVHPGEWTQFEMQIALGPQSKGSYTLVTRSKAGEKKFTLPYSNPTFKDIGWIGITTPDDAEGVCYLDALKLEIGK